MPSKGRNQSGGESESIPITEVGPTEESSNIVGPSNPIEQNVELSDTAQPSTPSSNPEVNGLYG